MRNTMIVLHGTWFTGTRRLPPSFILWGEGTPSTSDRAEALLSDKHPFALSKAKLLRAITQSTPSAVAGLETVRSATIPLMLPTLGPRPQASPQLENPATAGWDDMWKVPALLLSPLQAFDFLLAFTKTPDDGSIRPGDSLRFWKRVSEWVLSLVIRQRFVPDLNPTETEYHGRWRTKLNHHEDVEIRRRFLASMPVVCFRSIATDLDEETPEAALLDAFVEWTVDAVARSAFPAQTPTPPASAPRWPGAPAERTGKVTTHWIESLKGQPAIQDVPNELAKLMRGVRAWSRPADDWLATSDSFRLCFRLQSAGQPGEPANDVTTAGTSDWSLEFLLQANDDPSLLVPARDVWQQTGETATFLNRRFDYPQERLISGLARAAKIVPELEAGLLSATPERCPLTTAEAHRFIDSGGALLTAAGFGVLVPNVSRTLNLRLRLGRPSHQGMSAGVGGFGWNTIVAYDWEIALGDETLSREEFEALARLKQPLVQVRGQWVELRPQTVKDALHRIHQHGAGDEFKLAEALRLALVPNQADDTTIEVSTEGWLDQLLERIHEGARRQEVDDPPGFHGQLRPYQRIGVSWLATLSQYGLGACLADDMGLGKTIQLIALLLHQQAQTPELAGPTLLICPTSVVSNWQHEIHRFAPSMRVLVYQGTRRSTDDLVNSAERYDVVLSSYAILPRNAADFRKVNWVNLVLDEAQNIKNPSTQAAQAARRIPARWKVALTGTPVENRVSELWSIFEFTNPGFLGSAERFRQRFANPIEREGNPQAAEQLRALVSPFILRRLKTDRSIIDDLPEKNEMKVYCSLTREQATLYQAIIQDALKQVDRAEGIERAGKILAMLTKLKQVCDHPALFLHDQSSLAGRSGKLTRLTEMLEEVVESDDRALVFTQYAEMGTLLRDHLARTFGREVLFLHGGTPIPERDRAVRQFQSAVNGPPIFVLSIKAGGTGLNLTRANHVFHFDRWWNPAVENQATDRAFRIGQERNVQVHKFVCTGTFEEALDELIARKIELAESIVGSNEAWITELSGDDLRTLFTLREDAFAEV